MNKLAHLLKDFPLAIAQAGYYLKNNPSVNIHQYINDFKKSAAVRKELLSYESDDTVYKQTLETAYALTLKSLQESSPDAVLLLKACSFLNYKKIPLNLLYEFFKNNKANKIKIVDKPEPEVELEISSEDEHKLKNEFNNSLKILSEYSLINFSLDGKTLRMHKLLHLISFDNASSESNMHFIAEHSLKWYNYIYNTP